ncbi:hypothetical protein WDV93_20570 [Pantoea ananatis]
MHISDTYAYRHRLFLPASQQIPLLLCLVIFACWLLPGLVGHEPWKPDEAYTFGLIRHIAQSGDWVVPTLAGEPFYGKAAALLCCGLFLPQAVQPGPG